MNKCKWKDRYDNKKRRKDYKHDLKSNEWKRIWFNFVVWCYTHNINHTFSLVIIHNQYDT